MHTLSLQGRYLRGLDFGRGWQLRDLVRRAWSRLGATKVLWKRDDGQMGRAQ